MLVVSIMSNKTRQELSLNCGCKGNTIEYKENFFEDGLKFVKCLNCNKRIDFKWNGKIKRIYEENAQ